jgi:hypothetical protein
MRYASRLHSGVVHLLFLTLGGAAIAWAIIMLPEFWSQQKLANISAHIVSGDVYKPATFTAIEAQLENDRPLLQRPSSLSNLASVRLRRAELDINAGDRETIDSSLSALFHSIGDALANQPTDAFLWLVLFWVENSRNGFKPENLGYLQMSYQCGPNEGWIAVKRNRFALALFSVVTPALREAAISEFSGLVRSGYLTQTADLIAGPGLPVRDVLLAQVRDLKKTDREILARLLNERDITDALSMLDLEAPSKAWNRD